jgi:hypothetical protein
MIPTEKYSTALQGTRGTPADSELQNALEALVDQHSMTDVLDALAMVAFAKAEHLKSNWQDAQTAKVWEGIAGKIAKLASKCDL